MRQWVTAGLIALVTSLAAAGSARADTYLVTGGGDAANPPACTEPTPTIFQCSTLRGAVNEANAAANQDAIGLPIGTVTLTEGALNLLNDVSITGGGARSTAIVASLSSRVFNVLNGATVALGGLEIRGGSTPQGAGGNILTEGGTTLSMSLVRVTGGVAQQGAGIANGGELVIGHSLFDDNTAQAVGGAIYNLGTTDSAPTVMIVSSTLADNYASAGGAIRSEGNANNQIHLTHTTIARNGGGGISFGSAHPATASSSIIASNVEGANCSGAQFSSGSWNVSSDTSCGLTATTNRQNTDPGLAGTLSNEGGETNVLTIPAGSAAEDLVSPCQYPIDQRGFARYNAAGQACDAGAYERSATGGGGTQPPPGGGGEAPPPPEPTPEPPPVTQPIAAPAQEPAPVFQQTVVAREVSGTIRVRRPGSREFVDLDASQGIPLGSTVDAKRGAVEIAAAPRAGAAPEKATFKDGIFRVTQSRGITSLTLTEALAACPRRGARAAQRKPKTRKLFGDGRGSFRTVGRYSAATVRGTKWLVQDTCAGTLTRVTQGTVLVRDNVRQRNVTVRAGGRYLARPRR